MSIFNYATKKIGMCCCCGGQFNKSSTIIGPDGNEYCYSCSENLGFDPQEEDDENQG